MPAPPATRLAGTASAWVRDLLAQPDRVATVVHAGAHAVYLDVGGRCVGVLSASATAVPCGIRTLVALVPPVGVGDSCRVGSGRLGWGSLEVRVGRVVDQAVPLLDAETAVWARERLTAPALVELAPGPLALLRDGDPACVAALLGSGGGLTPLGDDVLAGWLAAMVAAGHPGREPVADEVARLAPTRTTLFSAMLLECARRGEVVPEFADLVEALGRRDHLPQLERLAAVGHTSGRGLALGLVLALTKISRRSLATRRTA
jgi:hypothetical protein